jgi:hypothetical protein
MPTTDLRPGKWIYVVKLEPEESRPSQKFSSREEVFPEASDLVAFIH